MGIHKVGSSEAQGKGGAGRKSVDFFDGFDDEMEMERRGSGGSFGSVPSIGSLNPAKHKKPPERVLVAARGMIGQALNRPAPGGVSCLWTDIVESFLATLSEQ